MTSKRTMSLASELDDLRSMLSPARAVRGSPRLNTGRNGTPSRIGASAILHRSPPRTPGQPPARRTAPPPPTRRSDGDDIGANK